MGVLLATRKGRSVARQAESGKSAEGEQSQKREGLSPRSDLPTQPRPGVSLIPPVSLRLSPGQHQPESTLQCTLIYILLFRSFDSHCQSYECLPRKSKHTDAVLATAEQAAQQI